MIRDRFKLRRDIRGKNLDRVQSRIEKSSALAATRKSSVPSVDYPESLPISARVKDITQAIQQNQVVIIAGETGSGKTTQIPKICLEIGLGVFGLIGHTQPRRVAARTVSQRIAEELGVKVGAQIGFQFRFTDHTSDLTHVKVMTDGILLAETAGDRFLEKYDAIIIDEAHERSLNIDFLLGYLKRILPKRPDLKVIVTSATIDVERFSSHFNNAPIIEVSGRTYPVEVLYRPKEDSKSTDSDEQMTHGVIETLREIEGLKSRGDVLVFLPGEREIEELAAEIRKSDLRTLEVLPLYSRLSVAEQNQVFRPHSQPRIILATNVAETSLTVPGIRYVIDPGLARISRYSYRTKIQQLPIEPVSQASAEQRKGRCGRVSAGVCFRLYSEADFLARPAFTQPEIMRTNLASVILQMLVLRLGDMAEFPFVEPPEQRQISDGFQLLFELEAVDQQRQITKAGREIARFPVDLRFARMLLHAGRIGCLSELLLITSALTVQDPRDRPHDRQQAADEAHRRYLDEQSDFIALVNLWRSYEKERQALTQKQLRKYCRDNFLSFVRMREWRDIHRQLHLLCKEMKLKENKVEADYVSIHQALLSGLLGNIGQKSGENEYMGARNRTHYIFPGSSQFKSKPKWIASSELVETSRLYARNVARIDNNWIEPIAQHLVKSNVFEPYFDPKRGQVMAFEEVMLYGVVIVNKRRIDFAIADPIKAREIFIQSGLVEQALKTSASFYEHNKGLIEDIEKLESKSRKRDILVDNYALYAFYDARLPADVSSEIMLRNFLKAGEAVLYLDRDQLMKQKVELSESLYPNAIRVADAELPIDYQFNPEAEEDGISINVPVAMLSQVSEAQLDWVIPGLLREKCLALIRSLPKALRKKFVPAPEYADRVVEQLEFDGRALVEVLAERLFRVSGTKVSPGDFNDANLEKHLNMNLRILDASGKTLGSGRDLTQLRSKFFVQADESFRARSEHELEQKGLTDWTFGDLPKEVEIPQGSVSLKGYPTLIDQGQSVDLEILDSSDTAAQQTQLGVLRLFLLRLPEQVKYLQRNIVGFEQFALLYMPRGNRDALLEDLIGAIFRFTFIEGLPTLATNQDFRARLQGKAQLISVANDVARLLGQLLKQAHEIETALETLSSAQHKFVVEDVKEQLHLLLQPGFLQVLPWRWLQQYPRYLKAIDFRLDKLQGNLLRDQQATQEINELMARWHSCSHPFAVSALHYRWMLEEYRISLFAQSVGTSIPVSSKRLEKQWQKAMQEQ